ncbi:translocation/assembly module TamB [Pontibacter sp. E15-1]|uniref:translocation/assembly module TamB domain-containing protein n=1 Tax=Pontibacter sp. E15-1 TaxID=2919918 RepID=UPI001F4F33A4|nr:translocation/assembly module TamB domain-containing protein [Pontibacter sp. E15-1]MCJ8166433.1 translocation/assembly module TamB [Pontibacter sp. E15-1]
MGLFLLLMLLFAAVFVAIRFPGVQTKLAQKAAAYLSETVGHKVTIGRIDIAFFSNIILEEVRVLDRRENEMLYIGKAAAAIDAFSIFDPNTLLLNTLELDRPRANLAVYEGTDTLNLNSFLNKLGELFVKDTTKPASAPFTFGLNELRIKDGRFTYDDFNQARTDYGMDYAHLTLDHITGSFSELQLEDTLRVTVAGLTAIETRSNTRLLNLDTRMTYADTFWEWDALDLQVNESNLQHYLRFDYSQFGDFSNFVDSVTMTGNLENSRIYSQDIATFAPQLKEYNENLLINSLELKGKVKDFNATNVDLAYGENTHIVGSISADGLPNAEETFANLRLKPSTLDARDLKQFLPKDTYATVARLGTVQLEGRFLGFYNDFVANGKFRTALGNLQSDINLKIDDRTRASSYKGYVTTDGFNIGRLLNAEDQIRRISMSGQVEGSGFTLKDANLKLDATIKQVQLLDYNYQNIKANGTLREQNFIGKVAIADPNLIFEADGEVNLAEGRRAFNMAANLERVDLQALKLTTEAFVISGKANFDFEGLRLDTFRGSASFDSALVVYQGKELAIDSLLIRSEITPESRSLYLTSDLLALRASGNFAYTTLIADLADLVEEYKLNFESDAAATQAYYARKPKGNPADYTVSYDIYLKHVNPLLDLFLPELRISDFSKVEGSFRHNSTVILALYADLDTILYSGNKLYGNKLELNTSKIQNNPDVLAAAQFTSDRQALTSAGSTQDFYLEGIWSERTINFSTAIRQPEQNNRAVITGDLNFLQNQLQVVFNRSNIVLQQNPWAFVPGNTLYISESGRRLVFENFALTNQDQVIRAEGTVSDEPGSKLVLNMDNFQLNNLNPLLSMKLAGKVNAEVVAQDIYDRALLAANMRVDSFYLDEVYIGNVVGNTDWSNAMKKAEVDVGIERNGKKVLTVSGNYNPESVDEQLDMLAVMDQANIKLVEPVLKSLFSNLEGEMEGRIRILGRLDYPVLKGSVMVNNGQFTFNYLNTTYRFSDRIYFGANSISFRNAQLKDLYGNSASMTGGIAHDGFNNMVIDLEARYRNFMVLNTSEAQNELFYGTAFATGTASVLGPVENLNITVDARSEENTRIVLPLDYQTQVARKDFIKFVNHNNTDSTGVAVAVEERVDLSGINMNFNLAVTDDAYFEIIIDRTTGDVIRGSGNGDIRMTIDTRGDFNMYGTFEITKGAYNLNLLEGLVTREFDVVPGGTISWNGDPVNGQMNITANYTQMASLETLVQGASPTQRRYPVTAVIGLTGPILSPQVKLGLKLQEQGAGSTSQDIESQLSVINNDESELNRQVFSLLVLQRLSPTGSLAFDSRAGASAVGGSLGSLLSSQLNNLFSSIDSNLEIDIGLDGIGQQQLASLQLRLSYSFFDGRLRLTNETGFGGVNNDTGNSTSYIGDWTLDYYISQSGELRARLQYSTAPDIYTGRIQKSQSISMLHTKRFDTFRELFVSNKRQRRQQERELERDRIILDSDTRLEL